MRNYDNNLYVLTIGSVKHKWLKIETKGQQPEARYQHKMYILESLNYLVIVGGRRF